MSTLIKSPEETENQPGTWQKLHEFLVEEVPRWLRYGYYLRFSILLWVFPLVLLLANGPRQYRSLVSGIVTPETTLQYLCVTYFLVAGSFVALILARIVVIHGGERFGDKAPHLLCKLLAHKSARHEWFAPVASQLNTAIVIGYFFWNGAGQEGVRWRAIGWGVAGGLVVAFVFWWVVTAIYYISYHPRKAGQTTMELGKPAARTLLLPRRLLWITRGGKRPCFGDALEDAEPPLPLGLVAAVFPIPGYRWTPRGSLFEGHFFSLLAGFGFFGLYATLWPLTAPVAVGFWSKCAIAAQMIGGFLVWLLFVALARIESAETPEQIQIAKRHLKRWKLLLFLPIMFFPSAIWAFYYNAGDASRFPILALVLILAISLTWLLGSIAFLADRFRVPVLTLFVVVLLFPRIPHWTGAQEEHHISIALRDQPITLPTPGAILDRRIEIERQQASLRGGDPTPTFVIVTSTGGGIHAAAWTAAVLERLEETFQSSFHDHVLLLSTVSGGSAGLYTYLRELHEIDPVPAGRNPDWSRMEIEARCSSLEAVGWGLVYYDIPKAIVPLLPYFKDPSSGVDDLTGSPLGKDRTWALRRAFARNLNDSFCTKKDQQPDGGLALTLGSFDALNGDHPFPAFTMNTTTVEDGARFLLANYRVERHDARLVPVPAESFLDVYGQDMLPGKSKYADLPLATAAQMSATFPYVSSAATFPAWPGRRTVHFVDGGYYDNDGTASAIEFLRAALDGSNLLHPATASDNNGSAAKSHSSTQPKVRILLVEIRNSLDPHSPDHPTAVPFPAALKADPKNDCKAWNLMDELSAPLKAFYGAGHESVTDRNRIGLRLLEDAYQDKLVLQHFVIDDRANGLDTVSCAPQKDPPTDPLNWSLTPKQQDEITGSVQRYQDKYDQIFSCFSRGEACPSGNEEAAKEAGH